MDTTRERDRAVERLLRESLQTSQESGRTDACLDADTLAMWMDGGLSGTALRTAESHVADCPYCQSIVGAMARVSTAGGDPGDRVLGERRQWIRWLVPLAAAAAVVTLWVAIPNDRSTTNEPASTASVPAAEEQKSVATNPASPQLADEQPQSGAAALTQVPAASARLAPTRPAEVSEFRADSVQVEADSVRQEAAAPGLQAEPTTERNAPASASDALASRAVAAAPPPAPATPTSNEAVTAPAAGPISLTERLQSLSQTRRAPVASPAAAGIEIPSPNPRIRWRIAGGTLERTSDGGSTWERLETNVVTAFTAGAAPSPTVCWVVGRGGAVLISTDGRTFRRVPFPEITDLSAVRATDARSGTVTTADGRTFSTSDAGATWQRP